jgi:hypothetical protein
LDTRTKIKNLSELRPLLVRDAWVILAGEFDPLTVEAIELIEKTRLPHHRLLVVLRSNTDELLSTDARAVLLAGLRSVDAVLVASREDWSVLTRQMGSVPIVGEAGGGRKRSEFEALVLARQRMAVDA